MNIVRCIIKSTLLVATILSTSAVHADSVPSSSSSLWQNLENLFSKPAIDTDVFASSNLWGGKCVLEFDQVKPASLSVFAVPDDILGLRADVAEGYFNGDENYYYKPLREGEIQRVLGIYHNVIESNRITSLTKNEGGTYTFFNQYKDENDIDPDVIHTRLRTLKVIKNPKDETALILLRVVDKQKSVAMCYFNKPLL